MIGGQAKIHVEIRIKSYIVRLEVRSRGSYIRGKKEREKRDAVVTGIFGCFVECMSFFCVCVECFGPLLVPCNNSGVDFRGRYSRSNLIAASHVILQALNNMSFIVQ